MRTIVRCSALGGVVCFLALAATARASVDLNGAFQFQVSSLLGPVAGTLTFTQSGTDLSVAWALNGNPFGPVNTGTISGGTIDPDTGVFALPESDTVTPGGTCTGNGLFGTASADSTTITGTWVEKIIHAAPPFSGCLNGLGPYSAARSSVCGDGVILGGEDCDDGNTANGDCCSSTCHDETAGSPCSDGNACTTVDACNGAGTCVGSVPAVCARCGTCVPGAGCSAVPDPTCTVAPGPATLRLDIGDRDHLTASARTPLPLAFGNPPDADVDLCIFSSDGSAWTPLVFASIPADEGICAGKPCWKSGPTSARYRNRAGSEGGIKVLKLGNPPSTSYRVQAGDPNLQPQVSQLPGTMAEVRVQIRTRAASSLSCLATVFANPVPLSPTKLRLRR